jgi:signal transduction histidine kinase
MPTWLNSIGSQLALSQVVTVLTALGMATLTTLATSRDSVVKAREAHLQRDAARIQQTYDNTRGQPDRLRQAQLSQLLETLSGTNHAYWISTANGQSIFPALTHDSIPIERIAQVEQATRNLQKTNSWNAGAENLRLSLDQSIRIEGQNYAISQYKALSYFTSLWVVQDITELSWFQVSLLQSATKIYIGSFIVSLLVAWLLTRRIISPLKALSRTASLIKAENLPSRRPHSNNSSTEVRELTEAFNALLDRLNDSMEQQLQFSRSVSHELRNPLMTMELCQRRLRREVDALPTAFEQALNIQQQELSRMKKLLDGLMSLFKASQPQAALISEVVNVDDVVQQAVAACCSQDSRDAIKVIRQHHPTDGHQSWLAMAQRDQLEQALINLIGNARKYSAPDQPIDISLDIQDNRLAVSIEDHGIGIPLADQPRIFEPFFRGGNTAGREGTGLGLPIVKALVEAMGGTLELWSRPQEGSRFTILLRRPGLSSMPPQGLA